MIVILCELQNFGRTQDIYRAILSRAGCRCLLIWHQRHVAVASEQCLTTTKALAFLDKWLHQPSPTYVFWLPRTRVIIVQMLVPGGFWDDSTIHIPRLWCLHSVAWAPLLIADCLHKAWAMTGWLPSPLGRSSCVSCKWRVKPSTLTMSWKRNKKLKLSAYCGESMVFQTSV